jgi:hypothetical protein
MPSPAAETSLETQLAQWLWVSTGTDYDRFTYDLTWNFGRQVDPTSTALSDVRRHHMDAPAFSPIVFHLLVCGLYGVLCYTARAVVKHCGFRWDPMVEVLQTSHNIMLTLGFLQPWVVQSFKRCLLYFV